jgi:Fe-S oxidoreductase
VEWEGTRGHNGILEPKKEFRRGTFGAYQQPRDILDKIPGLDMVEMPRMKENAFCCGAGGGVMDAYPDFAKWAAKERLTEAQSVAAEAIISACPYCKKVFSEASKENNMNIKVYDITEIILACM